MFRVPPRHSSAHAVICFALTFLLRISPGSWAASTFSLQLLCLSYYVFNHPFFLRLPLLAFLISLYPGLLSPLASFRFSPQAPLPEIGLHWDASVFSPLRSSGCWVWLMPSPHDLTHCSKYNSPDQPSLGIQSALNYVKGCKEHLKRNEPKFALMKPSIYLQLEEIPKKEQMNVSISNSSGSL